MRNKKANKGITLIALVVTVVVLTILSVSIVYSTAGVKNMNTYYAIKEDILSLNEAVQKYYMDNDGQLPIKGTGQNSSFIANPNDINPNDNNNYYEIDSSLLDVNLNKTGATDKYMVNEQSLTVYYQPGFVISGDRKSDNTTTHYTVFDEIAGGSFAKDYYSKITLPGVAAVSLTTSNKDKLIVTAGDVVTLKILANYEYSNFSNNISVTLKLGDTQLIESESSSNGKIQTYKYTMPAQPDSDGQKLSINVTYKLSQDTSYTTITKPTFNDGLTYQYNSVTKMELAKAITSNKVKIGDYINYTPNGGQINYENRMSYVVKNATATQSTTIAFPYRVYDVTNDGHVRIIADINNASINSYYGSQAVNCVYDNAVYYMNDVCKTMYSNPYYGTAKAVSIEDIVKHLTYNYVAYKNSGNYIYGATRTIASGTQGPAIFGKESIYGGTWEQSEQPEKILGEQSNNLSQSYQEIMPVGTFQSMEGKSVQQTAWEVSSSQIQYDNNIYNNIFTGINSTIASRCYNILTTGTEFCVFNMNNNNITKQAIVTVVDAAANAQDASKQFTIWPIITLNYGVEVSLYGKTGESPSSAWDMVEINP